MKIKVLALVLCVIIMLGTLGISTSAAQNTEDIIILYENDVHGEIEGYSKLSAMKKELKEQYAHVGVVSSGDYIQGSSHSVVSKGGCIVELMNLVGYDALTIGNHEFDYHLSRLDELIEKMNTKPVCCNFQKIGEEDSYYKPYSIVSYGEVDIAYIGITTPSTVTTTSPAQFKDENGNYIFTFHANDLYQTVQKNIDAAIAEGADYVVALSHIGDNELLYDIEDLIANTEGLDVVLDAHSHSVIEERMVSDKSGNEVVLSSTGTKFEYIGKLTISPSGIKTELIKTKEYTSTDPIVDAYLEQIEAEYAVLGNQKIGFSEVDLITHDEDGNRLVRVQETNLGDFCADALRSAMDADIGYINGGGIRAELLAGDVTYDDLIKVFPFNNTVVMGEIDGYTLRDMLEMALLEWPEECSFPHVSGVTFSVNTELPSSVVINENEEFCGVDGQYRVYDIKVFNREAGKYEPIDFNKTYTIASNNYYLVDHGSGMTMLEKVKVIKNDGMLDSEALIQYLQKDLNGIIGEEYREVSKNISFTKGFVTDHDTNEPKEDPNTFLIIGMVSVGVVAISITAVFIIKSARKKQKNI